MACLSPAGAPIPCEGWSVYDSYVTDPRYQRYFTIAWTSTFALAFLFTLPSIIHSLSSGRRHEGGFISWLGLYEDTSGYRRLASKERSSPHVGLTKLPRPLLAITAAVKSISLTTLPRPSLISSIRVPFISRSRGCSIHPTQSLMPFSLGTLLLVLLIPAFFLATLFPESQLRANPNRFGFLALAAIPPMFVLSSKNGAVQWLLGKGWTSVNFLHRWLGRAMVLMVLLHFYFWTVQWADTHQVMEFLSGTKEQRGIGALVFLLIIAVSSAGPLRRFSYPLFFTLHYIGIIGLLVFINKHTIYAQGWATYSVLAIYGLDIVGRLAGMRVRYVEVEPMEGGMVRVGMRGLHGGWRAGQHVSLRLFFTPPSPSIFSLFRCFEAHPFSIANAPPADGVLNSQSPNRGVELFIRSCGPGSWTGDLFNTAALGRKVAEARAREEVAMGEDGKRRTMHMLALVEGPYCGLGPFTVLDQETVLLSAGGSGMSFVIGVLDELVGRRLQTGQGGTIEVVWAVRSKEQIAWFEHTLDAIIKAADASPSLQVSLRVYLTCDPVSSSDLEASASNPTFPPPPIASSTFASMPHTQLIYARPHLPTLVHDTLAAALAPCGTCYPICRCGDLSGDGVCPNDEEECCSGPGPANGRELLTEAAGAQGQEKSLDALPSLGKSGSCCSPAYTADIKQEGGSIKSNSTAPKRSACCSGKSTPGAEPWPLAATGGCCAVTGDGCCSGAVEETNEPTQRGRLRVRTGGMAVVVCGPRSMITEMRNSVARVPIAKQARVGGISLHSEHFSL